MTDMEKRIAALEKALIEQQAVNEKLTFMLWHYFRDNVNHFDIMDLRGHVTSIDKYLNLDVNKEEQD